ncbi:HD domain-containing protein [Candidatus Gottesmanbacteria bacterium]|nr:HD domain-containing protein [Candidatus Gottesmanbacteria bacterium]
MKKSQSIKENVNFLFEALSLTRLQRTGWQILGDGKESLADHTFMVCMISLVLADKERANREKVLLLALFHDFSETRIGDVYKLSDLYIHADSKKALTDAVGNISFRQTIVTLLKDFEKKGSIESKVVHDADVLALCLYLKTLVEKGNTHAKEWLDGNSERLRLASSKKFYRDIMTTSSQDWWKREREKIHRKYKNE